MKAGKHTQKAKTTRPFEGQPYKHKKHSTKAKRTGHLDVSQIPGALIILAYLFLVTFAPEWRVLDTNASKFLVLSLLNIITFSYILTRNYAKQQPALMTVFFSKPAGMAYGVFLLIALLSFTRATNPAESMVHFAKLFSVFSSCFVLTILFIKEHRLIRFLVIAGSLLLIFDSLSVFYNIIGFIRENVSHIEAIKGVYSNKNILASAIFIKLPLALYLWMFEEGWLRRLGLAGLFAGLLATFFLATRGFLVGLIVVTPLLVGYYIYNYICERTQAHLVRLSGYLGALLLAFVIYSFILNNIYPQRDRHTEPVAVQLATIQDDAQESLRINTWRWSLDIIKNNPLLGVGAGNWKIQILAYENQHNTEYVYMYKAHNDFIEIMSETGVFGGLAYMSIFVLTGLGLIRAHISRQQQPQKYQYLFLATAGLLLYSFDAFFNFPVDRPEIQVLFAFFVAIGVAGSLVLGKSEPLVRPGHNLAKPAQSRVTKVFAQPTAKGFPVLMIMLMLASSYVLHANLKSSQLQRQIYTDLLRDQSTQNPDMLLRKHPAVPSISAWGESISTVVASYLMEAGRNEEVIELLRGREHVNPYDGRREYYMAKAFQDLGSPDSALIYSMKAHAVKPNYFLNVYLLTRLLMEADRHDEVGPYLDRVLVYEKSKPEAYVYATTFYHEQGEIDKAFAHIDTAYRVLPDDSLIAAQHLFLWQQKYLVPHIAAYRKAEEYFTKGDYAAAIPYFDEYISQTPFEAKVHQMRAFSKYHLGFYEESIEDINVIISHGEGQPNLFNLRGVCYRALGDTTAACNDFLVAMKAGDASGERNYRRFCE